MEPIGTIRDGAFEATESDFPPIEGSILDDTKIYCNVMLWENTFDHDILMLLNTSLSTLMQMGVLPVTAPPVKDRNRLWTDWIPAEFGIRLEMVKTYVMSKVKIIFDPPQSSDLRAALQATIDECEWRGFFEADTIFPPGV